MVFHFGGIKNACRNRTMWEHKRSVNGGGITKGFYTPPGTENYSLKLIAELSTKSDVQKPGLLTCFQGYTVPPVGIVFTAPFHDCSIYYNKRSCSHGCAVAKPLLDAGFEWFSTICS